MKEVILLFLMCPASHFKSRAALQAENLALRHQLCVFQRTVKRAKVRPADRILSTLLARVWAGWKEALIFVKTETVIRWQRNRFKKHWTQLSPRGEPGRPATSAEVQELIRTMSRMNPPWGSPRIVGELAKLGINVAKSTVERYMVRACKPPSQTWRAFSPTNAGGWSRPRAGTWQGFSPCCRKNREVSCAFVSLSCQVTRSRTAFPRCVQTCQ